MSGLKKPKYLKIYDIQNILKYIFLGQKRPHYVQLNPKPQLVVLLHAKNSKSSSPFTNSARPAKIYEGSGKSQGNTKSKASPTSQATNDEVDVLDRHLLSVHINENIPLEDLFNNILKSTDITKISLSAITPENLNLIEKHDVTHMFSYTNFIKSQTDFDESIFQTFLRPVKTSPYFLIALDCEMMICIEGKQIGRISMVDHTGRVVYDKYVRPDSQVLDYVEKYSGLNHKSTSGGISLDQMRRDILDIIGTNTFLLGHGLENDLEVMNFYTEKVIDTAYLFLSCEGYKTKLAQLSKKYFGESIQDGSHNSREDALCCLKLLSYKICQVKNFYDPSGESLNLGVEMKRVADPRDLEGAKGLRMLEVQDFDLGSLNNDQNVFYMIFYSKDGDNYIAMRQKNSFVK